MDIKTLYETTDLTIDQIAKQCGYGSFKPVFNYVRKHYSSEYRKTRKSRTYRASKLGDKNPMHGKCGELHHNKRPRVRDGKGYWLVLKPDWYTGRAGSKHVFEHHVVVCLALGITAVPPGYVVHHCDGDPTNNDFGNLVMLTMAGHSALHQSLGRATTISKESTLKWAEAQGVGITRHDIVKSIQECIAAKATTA